MHILNQIWSLPREIINYRCTSVLIRLAFLASANPNNRCCQTLAEISAAVKYNTETLTPILDKLHDSGLLTKHLKPRYKRGEGITYEINVLKIEELSMKKPC